MTSPRRRRPELPGFEHLRHCNAGSSDPTFTNRSGLVEEKPVVNRPSFRVVLAALSMVVVACGSAQDGDAFPALLKSLRELSLRGVRVSLSGACLVGSVRLTVTLLCTNNYQRR